MSLFGGSKTSVKNTTNEYLAQLTSTRSASGTVGDVVQGEDVSLISVQEFSPEVAGAYNDLINLAGQGIDVAENIASKAISAGEDVAYLGTEIGQSGLDTGAYFAKQGIEAGAALASRGADLAEGSYEAGAYLAEKGFDAGAYFARQGLEAGESFASRGYELAYEGLQAAKNALAKVGETSAQALSAVSQRFETSEQPQVAMIKEVMPLIIVLAAGISLYMIVRK